MKIFDSFQRAVFIRLRQKLDHYAPNDGGAGRKPQLKQQKAPTTHRKPCADLPIMEVYIDGSFRDPKASWAYVAVANNKVLHEDYGLLTGPILKMRQVGGELKAAMAALNYARSQQCCAHIYYDYEGVFNWLGHLFNEPKWKAKNTYTQQYVAYMEEQKKWLAAMTKVKSHTGNRWNEHADELCAKAMEGK